MNKYLNIYWAENTNPRGGRFIIADSIADATKLALDSGMVKDIRNLIITKEPEDKYKDTNIKEMTKPGISWGIFLEGGKKVFIV